MFIIYRTFFKTAFNNFSFLFSSSSKNRLYKSHTHSNFFPLYLFFNKFLLILRRANTRYKNKKKENPQKMEYEFHTAKKTFRKYRVHILIGLSILILIGLTIAISNHDSHEEQSDQGPQQEQDDQSASVTGSKASEEPPQAIIQEHTTTVDITDYKIINTYVRQGKQYYTYYQFSECF